MGEGAFLSCRDVAGRSTHDRIPPGGHQILKVTRRGGFSNPGLQAALKRHVGAWDFPMHVAAAGCHK